MHSMTRTDKALLLMLALSVVVPRVPVLGLGLLGMLRLDHIVLAASFVLCFFRILFYPFYILLFGLFIAIMLSGLSSVASTAHFVGSIYSVFFIIQWIIYFDIGLKFARCEQLYRLKFLLFCLFLNSLIAFASRFTGVRFCSEYLHGSILTSPCFLDEYGLSGAPYVFGAHSIALLVLSFLLQRHSYFFLGFISLVFGDSRAFFAAFIPSIFVGLFQSSSTRAILFLIVLVPFIFLAAGDTKVMNGFSADQFFDRSLGMRLDTWSNFLDWIDVKRLLFGNGFAAYLDFSVQYGQPGPADSLYIRLISEIGLVGFFIFLFSVIWRVYRVHLRFTIFAFLFILGVLILGLVQESHLASKSGQIIAFLSGLIFIRLDRRQNGQ